MEKLNRILKGVNQDLDPRYQPEDTLRDSVNGIIISVGADSYAWRPIGRTKLVFTLTENEKIYGHCKIKNRLILLTLNRVIGITYFREVTFDKNMNATVLILSQKAGNPLNLSPDHPIRVMLGFYESENIQRVYFTDYNNQPRVVNIGRSTFNFNEKFADFFPVLEHLYGIISLSAILPDGNLQAGNYFFTWQYYTNDGYYTDWSYLSNPVSLTGDNPVSGGLFEYQRMKGQAPNFNTKKSIRMKLSNIDTDYNSIRVAAFYSNNLNNAQPGVIFFDSNISGIEMHIIYRGGENIGTILINDLVIHSTVIEKAKEMRFLKKRNVIAVIKEKDELKIGNQLRVNIRHEMYEIPVDVVPGAITGTETDRQALFAVPHVSTEILTGRIRAGVWYKVVGTTNLSWTNIASIQLTENLGTRFKPTLPGTYIPGTATAIPIIRRKLYKLNTSIPASPTNLVTTRGIQRIILQWIDHSFVETGHRIEHRIQGNLIWQTNIVVGQNVQHHEFIANDHTIIWEFRVWAFNTHGNSSSPSNTVSQRSLPPLPAAPSVLAASSNQIDRIVLTWTDNSNNENGFILNYRLKGTSIWNESPMFIAANLQTIQFTSSSLKSGDIFNYSIYEFRLRSFNESGSITGTTGWSNIAEGRALQQAPTAAPSSFSVFQEGNCLSMRLTWQVVERAAIYRIERYNHITLTWESYAQTTELSTIDGSAAGLNNVFFYYRVRAENISGVGPWTSLGAFSVCRTGGGERTIL